MNEIAQLRKDITSNNLKARKLFIPLRENLRNRGVEPELKQLSQALDGLQFSIALTVIDTLAERLGVKE